jgi:hypothetical protein
LLRLLLLWLGSLPANTGGATVLWLGKAGANLRLIGTESVDERHSIRGLACGPRREAHVMARAYDLIVIGSGASDVGYML